MRFPRPYMRSNASGASAAPAPEQQLRALISSANALSSTAWQLHRQAASLPATAAAASSGAPLLARANTLLASDHTNLAEQLRRIRAATLEALEGGGGGGGGGPGVTSIGSSGGGGYGSGRRIRQARALVAEASAKLNAAEEELRAVKGVLEAAVVAGGVRGAVGDAEKKVLRLEKNVAAWAPGGDAWCSENASKEERTKQLNRVRREMYKELEALDSLEVPHGVLREEERNALVARRRECTKKLLALVDAEVADESELMLRTCTVCEQETELRQAPCGHRSCMKCWSEWLPRNNTCPFCRRPIYSNHQLQELLRKDERAGFKDFVDLRQTMRG